MQPAEPAPTVSDGAADNGVLLADTTAEAEAGMAADAKALLGAEGVVVAALPVPAEGGVLAGLPAPADVGAAFFLPIGAAAERGDSSDPPAGPAFPWEPVTVPAS